MEYPFSRKLRIRAESDFKESYRLAKRWKSRNITFFTRMTDRGCPRLGISISRRQIKLAVDRNRVKRLIRESFRLRQSELNSLDIVAVAYKGADLATNEQLYHQLNELWVKLITCYRKPSSS